MQKRGKNEKGTWTVRSNTQGRGAFFSADVKDSIVGR